jgi:hypothetical protein
MISNHFAVDADGNVALGTKELDHFIGMVFAMTKYISPLKVR